MMKAEGRRMKAEGRRQKAEGRRQKAEGRRAALRDGSLEQSVDSSPYAFIRMFLPCLTR